MKKIAIASMALMMGALISTGAMATVPSLIPVQGVLADDMGDPVDGPTDITFSLYSVETAGTALWTDGFNDIDVVDGFFTVYLGSDTALDFASLISNSEIWLGINVEGDGEMDRIQLAAVPFAVEAQVCGAVGSLTESDINSNFSAASHDHDADYAAIGHNHDTTYAPLSHTHAWSTITGIPAGFADGTDNVDDTVAWSEISGIVGTAASTVAAGNHNHDAAYVNVTGDTMTGALTISTNLTVSGDFYWGGSLFNSTNGGYEMFGALAGYSCETVCTTHSMSCSGLLVPMVIPGAAATTCASTTGNRMCPCYN
jgi:hypothetical protein